MIDYTFSAYPDKNIKLCAVCKKAMNLENKATFKTVMHNSMHAYVCSSKCVWDFYRQ